MDWPRGEDGSARITFLLAQAIFKSLPCSPLFAAASGFSVFHPMDVSIHLHRLALQLLFLT